MPFDAQHALNNLGEKVSSAPLVKNIVKNPFYTAILISVIIVMTVLFVFRNAKFESEDSLFRLAVRSGIYSLLFVTVVQFLQNQNVIDAANAGKRSSKIDEVFERRSDDQLFVKVEPVVYDEVQRTSSDRPNGL